MLFLELLEVFVCARERERKGERVCVMLPFPDWKCVCV